MKLGVDCRVRNIKSSVAPLLLALSSLASLPPSAIWISDPIPDPIPTTNKSPLLSASPEPRSRWRVREK